VASHGQNEHARPTGRLADSEPAPQQDVKELELCAPLQIIYTV